jgi:hypothetical protein
VSESRRKEKSIATRGKSVNLCEIGLEATEDFLMTLIGESRGFDRADTDRLVLQNPAAENALDGGFWVGRKNPGVTAGRVSSSTALLGRNHWTCRCLYRSINNGLKRLVAAARTIRHD